MRRRQFLKATAATTVVAATSGPIILGAEDKAGSKNPVLGVEGHKYEVTTHAWGTLPNDYSWQTTHNVALDSAGNVWSTGPGSVIIISPQGKLLGSILTGVETGNRAWGDADHKTLYITANMFLLRVKTLVRGN